MAAIQASTNSATFVVSQVAPVQTYSYSASTTTVFTVNQGTPSKLQLLVTGESPVPGTPSGKTGTPNNGTPFTAGQFYTATVNATDSLFNLVPSAAAQVQMTVNDPYAPQTNIQQNLLSGTTIFQFQFLTANPTGWQITVSTISGTALANYTSPLLPVVPNTPTKIMVTVLGTSLVPGNVGAGGLSGSPNPETAGTTWLATATITDNYYNPVGNAGTGSLYFQTSDPYDVDGTTSTLSQGTTNFMVTMVTAGNQSLSIYPSTLNQYSTGTVSGISIVAAALDHFQLLLPSETAAPGSPTGMTGSPSAPFTAGQSYVATVNAVDAFFNLVSTNSAVSLYSDDPYGTPSNATPLTQTLVSGISTYTFTLLSAQTQAAGALTHNLFLTGSVQGDTSPNFSMKASTATKMQILLPGETPQPGATTGKTAGSSPTSVIVGETYAVTVRLTDNWFNASRVRRSGERRQTRHQRSLRSDQSGYEPIVRGRPGDLHLNL